MKPYLEILKLVWPLALGMINNAVMQFADRAYLAHDSMASLEAVLPAGMLAWVFMGFFQSVVVFVAQYHGAKDFGMCRACYRAAVALALVAGALMLPMFLLGDWILGLTAPSAEVLALERTYFGPLILGGIFVYGQMAATAYFTGRGLTRIVFWVNLFGNLLNIALDPILIFGCGFVPRMGIAGHCLFGGGPVGGAGRGGSPPFRARQGGWLFGCWMVQWFDCRADSPIRDAVRTLRAPEHDFLFGVRLRDGRGR